MEDTPLAEARRWGWGGGACVCLCVYACLHVYNLAAAALMLAGILHKFSYIRARRLQKA